MQTVCRVEALFDDEQCSANRRFGNFVLNDLLHAERQVFLRAYLKELGLPRENDVTRRGYIDCLDDHYQKYGLSTGRETTKLLIQEIEEAARAHARAVGGPTR